MNTMNLIALIARTEFKLIGRNWTFRLLTVCMIVSCTWYALQFFSNFHASRWVFIALPAAMPFTACYLLNIMQVLLICFTAGNFWKTSRVKDTTQVFMTRPFDNHLYVTGKFLGTTLALSIANGIALSITLLIHLFASHAPFNLFYYIFYYTTLLLPTTIFYTGITLFVKNKIKNEALALFSLLFFAVFLTALSLNHIYAADIFALEIPNLFSEITFAKDSSFYLQQRLYLFMLGTGIGVLAATGTWRLTNPYKPTRAIVGLSILLCSFIPLLRHYIQTAKNSETRKIYQEHYRRHANELAAHIESNELTFRQLKESILVKSRLTLTNPHPTTLPHLLLYLNPGLKITKLTLNGHTQRFTRKAQLIIIDTLLASGDSIHMHMMYEGRIDERICYPEISTEQYLDRKTSSSSLHYRFERHYAFADRNYTLLTPECLWYPVCEPPVNITHPIAWNRQFTHYTLTIKDKKLNQTISLGEGKQHGEDVVFQSKNAYAGLPLSIGKYNTNALIHQKHTYKLLHYKGHDRLCHFFKKKDLLKKLDKLQQPESRNYVESWGGTPHRISLVETPLSFHCFPREGRTSSERCQSEILFIPERGFDIPLSINTRSSHAASSRKTDPLRPIFENYLLSPTHLDISGNTIFNLKTSFKKVTNTRNLIAMFAEDINFIADKKYPGLNYIFLQLKRPNDSAPSTAKLNWEYDSLLQKHTLFDIFHTHAYNHGSLTNIILHKTTEIKDRLFAALPREEVCAFITDFFSQKRYKQISIHQFTAQFQKRFNIDFTALLDDVYYNHTLTSYKIKDVNFYQVKGTEPTYAFTFKAWNNGKRDGILKLHYIDAETYTPKIIYFPLKAGVSQEFRITWPYAVHRPILSTGLAHNIPDIYTPQNNRPFMPIPEIDALTPGIFEIDSSEFIVSNPDEFIVDNRDSNFYWHEGDAKLINQIKKSSDTWKFPTHANFYGESIRDAALHKANNKNSRAEWHVTLPQDGKYEVFIYNPDILQTFYVEERTKEGINLINAHSLPEYAQHYSVCHAQGEDNIQIDLKNAEPGWVSLGSYFFSKGTAKIILHDQLSNPNFYIIADAVKWKKF